MAKFEWTDGQREVMSEFKKWTKSFNDQIFDYVGPAGTGKTTIIPEMMERSDIDIYDEVIAMSFTGRAASNLSTKGIPATSVHSALMDCVDVPKLDKHGNEIKVNGRVLTKMEFRKKAFLPKSVKMLLVDEGYFIDKELGQIIESFDLPICVTGDRHQLGPIYGKPHFLSNPKFELTEITRQAKESGIIELATRLRLGKELPNRKYMFKHDAFIIPKHELMKDQKSMNTILLNSDIIICGKNKTRNFFNKRLRNDILGINSKFPTKGDKIVCRSNYWNRALGGIPLTNGIMGTVLHDVDPRTVDLKSRTIKIDFQPEYIEWDYYDGLPIDIDFFIEDCGPDKEANRFNKGIKMELGHAITTHMAQGSDFDTVCYWHEPTFDPDFSRRLGYTGATRAKKILIYMI